jgi:hypothetical protein
MPAVHLSGRGTIGQRETWVIDDPKVGSRPSMTSPAPRMRDMGAGFIQPTGYERTGSAWAKKANPKLRREACEAPSTNLTGNASYEGACIDPHGYDAGNKIKGKKRHILVDTLGLLLHALVHPIFGFVDLVWHVPFSKDSLQMAASKDRLFERRLPRCKTGAQALGFAEWSDLKIEIVNRSDKGSRFKAFWTQFQPGRRNGG